MIFTEWFNHNVKPVHVGVYQWNWCHDIGWYSYWDGQCWYEHRMTPMDALHSYEKYYGSTVIKFDWRGLANKP